MHRNLCPDNLLISSLPFDQLDSKDPLSRPRLIISAGELGDKHDSSMRRWKNYIYRAPEAIDPAAEFKVQNRVPFCSLSLRCSCFVLVVFSSSLAFVRTCGAWA